MRLGLRIIVVAMGVVMALVQAEGIVAHAKLVRAQPAPRSTVKVAPRTVQVWFNDELDPKRSTISVSDSRGTRVDDGKGGVDLDDLDRRSMIVRLKAMGPGVYTVRWKAVSADDRYVAQGRFPFTVARP